MNKFTWYFTTIVGDKSLIFLFPTIVVDTNPAERVWDIAITWLFWQIGVCK